MKKVIRQFGFTWTRRTMIFFSVFGGIWLLIEPIGTFDILTEFMKNTGVYGYLALLIFSAIITLFVEIVFRFKQTRRYEFIKLKIELIHQGIRIQILAPIDIKVSTFLIEFADFIEREQNYSHLKWTLKFSEPTLSVKRNDIFQKLDNNLTLREAGVKENEICRIGNIVPASSFSHLM